MSLDVPGCLDFLLGLVASPCAFGTVEAGDHAAGIRAEGGSWTMLWKPLHAVQQESTVWQVSSRWRGEACVLPLGYFWCPVAELQLNCGGERFWAVSCRYQG